MPTSDRPRFSLRSLMIFVVLVGVYLAGTLREYQQFGTSFAIIAVGSGCVYLAVEFFYRDLSRWMWLLIATILLRPLAQLIGVEWFFPPFIGDAFPLFFIVSWMIQTFPPLFGTIMLYRDIRRQLRGYQEQIRVLSALVESSPAAVEPPPPDESGD